MSAVTIRTKLLLCFLLLGLTLVALIGWMSYTTGKNALTHASLESLKAIREMKRRQIERYFEQLRQQCFMLAAQDATIEAMKLLKETFYTVKDELKINKEQFEQYKRELAAYYQKNILQKVNIFRRHDPLVFEDLAPRNDNALILQYLYIVKNKTASLSEDQLRCIAAGTRYSKIYAHYVSLMREYSKRMKVYDVYLFDLETGYSLLETAGEIDFANSVIDGGLKNTNLAQAIEYVRTASKRDSSKIVDFQFYAPSLGAPAAFIAVPIFDGDKKIGGLGFELLINEIDSIMTDDKKWKDVGLGNTGESYLIGSDYKMRSISRLLVENPKEYFKVLESLGTDRVTLDKIKLYNTSILLQDITTEQAEAALRGELGVTIAPDYRGVQVLTAYAPVAIPDVHWGIVSKIDAREALAPVAHLAKRLLTISLVALTLLSILIIPFTRWILRPIRQLNSKIQQALLQEIEPTDFEEESVGDIGILSHSVGKLYKHTLEFEDTIQNKAQGLEHLLQRMYQEATAFDKLYESIPAFSKVQNNIVVFDQAIEQSRQYSRQLAQTLGYSKKLCTELIDTIQASIKAALSSEHPKKEQYMRQALYTCEQLIEYIQSLESLNNTLNATQESSIEIKQQLISQVQDIIRIREISTYNKHIIQLIHELARDIERLKDL